MVILYLLITIIATGDQKQYRVDKPYPSVVACSEDAEAQANNLADIVNEHVTAGTKYTIQFACVEQGNPA